jgi:predicted esterase
MNPTMVFIHGLESSSRGTKGAFFRKKYPEMIIEDFSGSFEKRMNRLQNLLHNKNNLLLVGSSYGGLMAAVYAFFNERDVKKLVLLAPALNLAEFTSCLDKKSHIPVMIFHGKYDDVVPPFSVHHVAQAVFTNLQHHIVEDDHSLHNTFTHMDWDDLLTL